MSGLPNAGKMSGLPNAQDTPSFDAAAEKSKEKSSTIGGFRIPDRGQTLPSAVAVPILLDL